MIFSDDIKTILLGIFSSLLAEAVIALGKWSVQLLRQKQNRLSHSEIEKPPVAIVKGITVWGSLVALSKIIFGGIKISMITLPFLVFLPFIKSNAFCSSLTNVSLFIISTFIVGVLIEIRWVALERTIYKPFPSYLDRTYYFETLSPALMGVAISFFMLPLLSFFYYVSCKLIPLKLEYTAMLNLVSLPTKIIFSIVLIVLAFFINFDNYDKVGGKRPEYPIKNR